MHVGHVRYLKEARLLGEKLVVGLNSDKSVQRLKGDCRPIVTEQDRKEVLESLSCVDEVVVFDEETPLNLIKKLKPDVLVKGGDYKIEGVVGAEEVLSWGGEVKILNFHEGRSSTALIQKAQLSK